MYKALDTVLEWAQDGKWKSLHDNPQMIDAAITQFHALLKAAQQSVQSDKCPACDGKGWFGAQFCEGEECPACDGTGICR